MLARQVLVGLIGGLRVDAGMIIMRDCAKVYQTKVNQLQLKMLVNYQVKRVDVVVYKLMVFG